MTIKDRFDLLINHYADGNKSLFARKIGVANTVIENIVGKRKGNPSFQVLQKIALTLDSVNLRWLIIGSGEIFIK